MLKLIVPLDIKWYLAPTSDKDDNRKSATRIYRYVSPNFQTSEGVDDMAMFSNLPIDTVLTVGLDTVPSWLVMATKSKVDLDNLLIPSNDNDSVRVEYSLKNIMIEGHSRDFNTHQPPRGLELQLIDSTATNVLKLADSTAINTNVVGDTIVMANLGYFQLKSNPGIYQIQIREGKSNLIYKLYSLGDNNPMIKHEGMVVMDQLNGVILFPLFEKRHGMHRFDLITEGGETEKDTLLTKINNK